MTAHASIVQLVLDSMLPGVAYSMGDVLSILRGNAVNDVQLRNALCFAYYTKRTLRTGRCMKYRYFLNPNPPAVPVRPARRREPAPRVEPAPALAPNWPASRMAAYQAPQSPRWSIRP